MLKEAFASINVSRFIFLYWRNFVRISPTRITVSFVSTQASWHQLPEARILVLRVNCKCGRYLANLNVGVWCLMYALTLYEIVLVTMSQLLREMNCHVEVGRLPVVVILFLLL